MKILIKKNEGVSIMNLIDADLDAAIEKWKAVHPEEYLSHEEISEEDIPKDKYFRDAWGHDLEVDMEKAREIHMNKIREARAEKLQALDIETLKGIDVQMEKQILRDIPKSFDLSKAKTPEDLKKMWPKEI